MSKGEAGRRLDAMSVGFRSRYVTYEELTRQLHAWAENFPDFVRLRSLGATPQGREIDYELRYSWPLLGGDVSSNLFLRRNPGNYAAFPSDKGGAVRLTLGF